MLRITRDKRGITLIALVITIIVLLILAGISIAIAINGGIIDRGKKATSEYKASEQNEVEAMKVFESYIATQGTMQIPALKDGNITWTITTQVKSSGYTNTDISLEIETTETGYTLQYNDDIANEDNWKDYSKELTISNNKKVSARLVDKDGSLVAGDASTYEIKCIDKDNPTIGAINVTSQNLNDITIESEQNDDMSGVVEAVYQIKKVGDTEYIASQTKTYKASKEDNLSKIEGIKFEGLEQDADYEIDESIIDGAGNTVSKSITTRTSKVADLTTDNTTFTLKPTSSWTNENITLTIASTEATNGYTLQYSEDAKTWYEYTGDITIRENKTIYARLVNGNNYGNYTTTTISNIDKVAPSKPSIVAQTSSNTIIAKASGSTDTVGALSGYRYSIDGNNWSTTIGEGNSYNFSNLTSNTTYTVSAKAIDQAGNISEIATTTATITGNKTIVAKVGDYVTYPVPSASKTISSTYTGTSNQTFSTSSYTGKWRVLYNDGTNIQLIATGSIGSVTLGQYNGYRYSAYTLNQICSIYNNTTYADSTRSVGCVPGITEDIGKGYTYYFPPDTEPYSDSRFSTDYTALTSAGLANIGSEYWLGSRLCYWGKGWQENYLFVYYVNSSGESKVWTTNSDCLFHSYSSGSPYGNNFSRGVRPVVKIKSSATFKSGSGTSSDPYIFN